MAHRRKQAAHGNTERESAEALLGILVELTTELHPGEEHLHAPALDVSLERDLGLDSLARVELLTRVERHFGIALPEHVFAEVDTPRDLLRAVLAVERRTGRVPPPPVSPIVREITEGSPDTARTLLDVLDWHVRKHPNHPHVQFYSDNGGRGVPMSYQQLRDGAAGVGASLQRLGLRPGERVVIMLPTGPNYLFTFFGILFAGGIPVPIYPPARMSQIEDHLERHRGILANSLAAQLITVPEAKGVARLLRSQVDSLRRVVTINELTASAAELRIPQLGEQDIAFLQYTSGSTGNPKGVVLTHANLLANIRVMGRTVRASADDVFVSWLPLYHDMGLIGAWLGSLYFGALVVLMSPLAFIARPERWLWALHRYQGTLSASPNFGYEFCLRKIHDEDIRGLDLSHWRVAFNGAESISARTLEQFTERFSAYGFRREALMPVYGLAEGSVGLTFPPLDRGPHIARVDRETLVRSGRAEPAGDAGRNTLQIVSCGRPLAGHQVRVVDDTGRELPDSVEGHVQFRGPSATSGYFRNPEQTKELFDGDWLNTGDMGYIAAGEVFITGRSKDVIIRAGRNIYPHELEEAVGSVPGVRRGCVAAIGSPDPVSGTERLVVLAETREGDAKEALRARIKATTIDVVGTPPDDVVLLPPHSVLKTSSGKLRRAACRALYESNRLGAGQRPVGWQLVRLGLSALGPVIRRALRALRGTLYAAYAWTTFGVLGTLALVAVAVLPRMSWRWRAIHHDARWFARATGTPLTVVGYEHLPAATRPCVVAANHASYLDGYALVATLRRPFSFVAKVELTRQRIAGLFLKRIGTHFVERFDAQRGVNDARQIAAAAQAGRSLLFFPEGTFTRVPGLLPFHMGAFMAAADAGVPLVPVAIRGTRSILRDGSWFPRHGQITITIGEPIEPRAVAREAGVADTWQIALRLRDRTREHILRHCGEPDLGHEI